MDAVFNTLTLARLQFALTTMFHMIWPTLTIGLSALLVILEVRWIQTDDPAYYRHLRFWSKLLILNFSVGVATGLVLEFEFGTNWQRFTYATGGFFGHILGFEGTLAFMIEAAFLGIMIFGWHKVPRGVHLFSTIMVAFGATLSGFLIIVANSWMQTPTGGVFEEGVFQVRNYMAALVNPDMPWAALHMWVACVETSAFVVGGISAWYILKDRHPEFFLKTLRIALVVAIVITPVQIFVGDEQGLKLGRTQPEKLAAMEAHWETNHPGTSAPWNLLAWPDRENARNAWALEIPGALSIIETHKLKGQVAGLQEFPPQNRPPVVIPFYSFRLMVLIGILLFALMAWTLFVALRRGLKPGEIQKHRKLLLAWVFSIPLGYLAVEAGWLTREVGRQPWIIYGALRTNEAFSKVGPGMVGTSLVILFVIYVLLGGLFLFFARKLLREGPDMSLQPPPSGGFGGTGTGSAEAGADADETGGESERSDER